MKRPIGVTILAIVAGVAGVYQLYRMLVFLGVLKFEIVGKAVTFGEAQWGPALWALILAAIWFWVAYGFWYVRASAWQFGVFISLFTLIWGFFALLFGSTVEAETVPWLASLIVYFYLSWPGVKEAFIESEMSRLTPEQRSAMEQLAAANTAAAMAQVAPSAKPPVPPSKPSA